MTWKEFKEEVERQGVKDDDEIGFIDWNDLHKIEAEPAHTDEKRRWWIT